MRSRPGSAPTAEAYGPAGGGAVYGSPGSGSEMTSQRLALTYEAIYGQPESYIESDSARTGLWLIIALLLNVVCIRIELLLFQDLMGT